MQILSILKQYIVVNFQFHMVFYKCLDLVTSIEAVVPFMQLFQIHNLVPSFLGYLLSCKLQGQGLYKYLFQYDETLMNKPHRII